MLSNCSAWLHMSFAVRLPWPSVTKRHGHLHDRWTPTSALYRFPWGPELPFLGLEFFFNPLKDASTDTCCQKANVKLAQSTPWSCVGGVGVQLHPFWMSAVDKPVANFASRQFEPRGKNLPVRVKGNTGWTTVAVWTLWTTEKLFPLAGIEP